MTKTELVQKLASACGLSNKQTEQFINELLDTITNALAADEILTLTGFGSFGVKNRAARKGRNPQTGKEVTIAAKKVPYFKAGKNLKEAVAD